MKQRAAGFRRPMPLNGKRLLQPPVKAARKAHRIIENFVCNQYNGAFDVRAGSCFVMAGACFVAEFKEDVRQGPDAICAGRIQHTKS